MKKIVRDEYRKVRVQQTQGIEEGGTEGYSFKSSASIETQNCGLWVR